MEPENLRFGGGAADTLLHPLVAVGMVLAIILILCLPRKYAVAPLLLSIFTVPIAHVVVLGGIHFTVLRILILAGLVRWAVSRKAVNRSMFIGGFNSDDRETVALWTVLATIVFTAVDAIASSYQKPWKFSGRPRRVSGAEISHSRRGRRQAGN